tara:strand:- start:2421 stop:2792 length:372 start_codon:yes stop_codon:yes gene_type:complete
MVVLVGNKCVLNVKEINICVVNKKDTHMSRPKPTVILEHINNDNYKSDQVLEADAIWAVFYQEKPFNLKSANMLTNYPGPKYKKVSFSNPGHAHNLAKKLNDMFASADFSVYKLTDGEVVTEE